MKGSTMSEHVEPKASGMTPLNVLTIGVCWTGVAVVSYVSNDPDVTFAAIAATCYFLWEIFGRVQGQKEKRPWTP